MNVIIFFLGQLRASTDDKKKDRSIEGTRSLYEQQRKRLDNDIRRIENEWRKCKSKNYKAGLEKTLESLRREYQTCQREFDEFRCSLIANKLEIFKKRQASEINPVFWINLQAYLEEKDQILLDVSLFS